MILRDGMDKIMMTVRAEHYEEFPYPKDIARLWHDRISKLKFGKTWNMVINFYKHPWQTYKQFDEEKTSYGLHYMIRLNGMRQMRVMVNMMRYYNVVHGLELWKGRLHDDNVVLPGRLFDMTEFVDLMIADDGLINQMKKDYCKIRRVVFDDRLTPDTVVVDTHQMEIVTEAIGTHVSDIPKSFIDHSRCETIVRYFDETATVYLNTPDRDQVKVYQKGVGVMRVEATLNSPRNVVMEWSADNWMITESIKQHFAQLLVRNNIPLNFWEKREMKKETLLWLFADMLKLYTESKSVDVDLMKTLSELKSWNGTTDNKRTTERLRRKRLIKLVRKGKYVATPRLTAIQEVFKNFDRIQTWNNQEEDVSNGDGEQNDVLPVELEPRNDKE